MKTESNRKFLAISMSLLTLLVSGMAFASAEPDNAPTGGAVVATGCVECSINASSAPINASKTHKSSDQYDSYLPADAGSTPGAATKSTNGTQ